MKKTCIGIILCLTTSIPLSTYAATSHLIEKHVIDAGGNTCSSAEHQIFDVIGETFARQIWSGGHSIQAGYFNEYFIARPTPTITPTSTISPTRTITPTITPTLISTVTQTPIRQFGGELLSSDFVYAAPNPIRGRQGKIYFELAENAVVEIKILTTLGNLVLSEHYDQMNAGRNLWIWNCANIANGVYLLRIKATNSVGRTTVIVKKIALIK